MWIGRTVAVAIGLSLGAALSGGCADESGEWRAESAGTQVAGPETGRAARTAREASGEDREPSGTPVPQGDAHQATGSVGHEGAWEAGDQTSPLASDSAVDQTVGRPAVGSQARLDAPGSQAASGSGKGPAWVLATPGMESVTLYPGAGIELDGSLRTSEGVVPKGVALQFSMPAGGGDWSLISVTPLRAIPPGRPIGGRFARDFYRVVNRSGEVLYERPVVAGRDHAEWLDDTGVWHAAALPNQQQVISVRLPLPAGEERLEVLHRQGTDTPAAAVFSTWLRSKP